MRSLLKVLLPIMLLAGVLAFALSFARPAGVRAATCTTQTGSMTNSPLTIPLSVNAGDTISAIPGHTGAAAGATIQFPDGTILTGNPVSGTAATGGTATVTFQFDTFALPGGMTYTLTVCTTGSSGDDSDVEVPFIPSDDRINHHVADRAAPAAVYCREDGIQVIRIDPVTAQGVEDARISPAQIEAAGIPTEGNIVLLELDWVIVSRLAGERFQVNAWYADGKPYTLTWEECSTATIVYLER